MRPRSRKIALRCGVRPTVALAITRSVASSMIVMSSVAAFVMYSLPQLFSCGCPQFEPRPVGRVPAISCRSVSTMVVVPASPSTYMRLRGSIWSRQVSRPTLTFDRSVIPLAAVTMSGPFLRDAPPGVLPGAVEVRERQRDEQDEQDPAGGVADGLGGGGGEGPGDGERGDDPDRELPVLHEEAVEVLPDRPEHLRHAGPRRARRCAGSSGACGPPASSRQGTRRGSGGATPRRRAAGRRAPPRTRTRRTPTGSRRRRTSTSSRGPG